MVKTIVCNMMLKLIIFQMRHKMPYVRLTFKNEWHHLLDNNLSFAKVNVQYS